MEITNLNRKEGHVTHGDLFSGIGGWSLAAMCMGWTSAFHCEIDPFCQKVLTKNFPNSEKL